MNPKNRQSRVIDIIRQQGKASVEELAHTFDTSQETIRRDLTVLAETGIIQKIHGGAKLPKIRGEGTYQERLAINTLQKRAIARKAASLISPGETLFIDSGSTTLCFAEEIAEIENLTIITNSIEIASAVSLRQKANHVYLIGGDFDSDNRETYGPLAISQVQNFRAHHTVLTIGGIDASSVVSDFNIEEAHIARAMIDQSGNLIVLADSSKYNQLGAFKVCSLNKINYLISDNQPQGSLRDALERNNVTTLTGD